MSVLPKELVIEIISRLPVESLLRFKSINKTWHSIISDPEFAKLQLARSHNRQKLLVTTCPPQSVDYDSFEARNLNYPALVPRDHDQYFYPAIQGSCNGLVCLLDHDCMFIWNPTTGDCSQIPKPNTGLYSVVLRGIGYNRSTNDYGVVFGYDPSTEETAAELYTLKTRVWRRIKDTNLIPESYGLGSGISWNGDLYWVSIRENGYIVLCFDMVEEKFKEVLQLPDTDMDISNATLGMYEDSLCVFIECDESSFEGLVLNMKGNEVSYSRVFKYPHDGFGGYGNTPLCLIKTGQVVMDSDGYEVYMYDPKLGKINGRRYLHHETESDSVLYQESLVSPSF